MPINLRLDLAGQRELQRFLHPRYRVSVDPCRTLSYHATIEYKKSAFLVMLRDATAGRDYIAKILRKTNTDLWRPQLDTTTRHASLKTMDAKLTRFTPSINEGVFPILPSPAQGIVALGDRVSASEKLDVKREYLLLMNAIPRGESIPEVLRREAYVVPDVIDALVAIHDHSLVLPDDEQWQYGKAAMLVDRITGTDLSYFLRAAKILSTIRGTDLLTDTIRRNVDTVARHPALEMLCDELIQDNRIVDGHGNLWRENLQRGVYYHTKRLVRRHQSILCIDPDTNPTFTKQSVIMEAAMLLVDLRTQLPPQEARASVERYLRKMKLGQSSGARTLLAIAEGHKAMVRFYNAVLGDNDYDLAEKFLPIAANAYAEAAHILRKRRLDETAALRAGRM